MLAIIKTFNLSYKLPFLFVSHCFEIKNQTKNRFVTFLNLCCFLIRDESFRNIFRHFPDDGKITKNKRKVGEHSHIASQLLSRCLNILLYD